MTKIGDYEVHPAAEIVPKMTPAEFTSHAADVAKNGQRDPIVLTADGRVLDGRHRLRAAIAAGREPLTRTMRGTEHEYIGFVRSQLFRRNLTPSQTAACIVALADLDGLSAAAARAKGHPATLPGDQSKEVAKVLAKEARVSARTIRDALKVREDPALFERVRQGEVSVSVAAKAVRENRDVDQSVFRRTRMAQVYPLLATVGFPGGSWVDPCAGDGALIRHVHHGRAALGLDPVVHWTAIEKDDHRAALEAVGGELGVPIAIHSPVDLLEFDGDITAANVVATNWPWFGIVELVDRCFELAPLAWVAGLCDLMEFVDRDNPAWFAEHCPDLYHCSGRQKFDDARGGYRGLVSWLVWEPGRRLANHGEHEFLPPFTGVRSGG